MRNDDIQPLIMPRGKDISPAELFITLGRRLVIFIKDAEMYLYFTIARFIVWKEVSRDRERKTKKRDE
jgi:hypothetical protein